MQLLMNTIDFFGVFLARLRVSVMQPPVLFACPGLTGVESSHEEPEEGAG